jgi:hypothetical protein
VTEVGQGLPELLGLRDGPREAVEEEPDLRIGLGQAVLHHRHGDLVGDEVAGVHVDLRLLAELGLTADVGPEDVARRDRRNAEPTGDDLRLGALARSGGPQEDDAHYFRNPS